MIFRTALVTALLTLAVAGVAVAKGHHHRPYVGSGVAAKACKAENAANPTAFTAKYGNAKGNRAQRRCVNQHVRAARKACKAERTAGVAAFDTKYGTRPRANCIRQHAGAAVTG